MCFSHAYNLKKTKQLQILHGTLRLIKASAHTCVHNVSSIKEELKDTD